MSKQDLIDKIEGMMFSPLEGKELTDRQFYQNTSIWDCLEIIKSALESNVIVPEESSDSMDEAGNNEIANYGSASHVYKAMLSAAKEEK